MWVSVLGSCSMYMSAYLTLGVHALQGLQYLSCVCVCVSVCLSVCHTGLICGLALVDV